MARMLPAYSWDQQCRQPGCYMVINKKDCIFSLFLPAYVAIAFQQMFEFCCRYFAVCFLNQLILTKRDRELATRLISIYFSFFGVGSL